MPPCPETAPAGGERDASPARPPSPPDQAPRLCRDLADGFPLLTPVGDRAEEAAIQGRILETHCRQPPRALLDLGSGGGHNAGGRGMRHLEWRWVPEPGQETCVTDMAYLLRDGRGAVDVIHDRHVMGPFCRSVWLELIAAAGSGPLAIPFQRSSCSNTGHEVSAGLRPVRGQGA